MCQCVRRWCGRRVEPHRNGKSGGVRGKTVQNSLQRRAVLVHRRETVRHHGTKTGGRGPHDITGQRQAEEDHTTSRDKDRRERTTRRHGTKRGEREKKNRTTEEEGKTTRGKRRKTKGGKKRQTKMERKKERKKDRKPQIVSALFRLATFLSAARHARCALCVCFPIYLFSALCVVCAPLVLCSLPSASGAIALHCSNKGKNAVSLSFVASLPEVPVVPSYLQRKERKKERKTKEQLSAQKCIAVRIRGQREYGGCTTHLMSGERLGSGKGDGPYRLRNASSERTASVTSVRFTPGSRTMALTLYCEKSTSWPNRNRTGVSHTSPRQDKEAQHTRGT